MNTFVPQSIQTQIELELIANVENQIITPQSSVPIIGIVQDGLVGAYNMTHKDMKINWKDAMNLMTYTTKGYDDIKKGKQYSGTEVFSLIIPDGINIRDKKITIIDGKLDSAKGTLTKNQLGAKKKNSIIHLVWGEYGVTETRQFIDNTQRLINNFNLLNGFSVGIKDVYIKPELNKTIKKMFETKKLKVKHLITEIENNPLLFDHELFELTLFSELNTIRETISKLIINNLKPNNNFNVMLSSGSKGKDINMGQTIGCIGQQTVEGKRIQKKLNDRTIAYCFQNDDSAKARGFIERPFIRGAGPLEFIFHNMSAREGLIDTAIKSVTGDTPIIVMVDGKTKNVNIGDWIDSQLELSKDSVKHYEAQEMELLDLKTKTYIPTCDEDGKTSWGLVTAITRHLPGKKLYRVKTHGGREVIVTESKALLIWNKDSRKFEHTNTPKVSVGDFMPVTMSLPKSPIEYANNSVTPITNNIHKDFDRLLSSSNDEIEKYLHEFVEDDYKHTGTFEFDSVDTMTKYNMLFNRLGIFGQMNGKKLTINPAMDTKNSIVRDVVLDKIISIEEIDIGLYPKVYDLTVPSTINFGLANGLHVVDTAESGYIQRKLIKAMEDAMIKYDCTVRDANDDIIQYIYGDNGIDTVKQSEHKIKLVSLGNIELEKKYTFSKADLKKFKNYTEADNKAYLKKLIKMRNILRRSYIDFTQNYMSMNESFMLPVDLYRIIANNQRNNQDNDKDGKLEPKYILEKLEEILDYKNTQIMCMNKDDGQDPMSIKNKDERQSKTTFEIGLHEYLSPKKCIIDYGLNKKQFDTIIDEIIKNFNRAVIQPGEMVGIIAAQSIGEPITQMTLNTFHSTGIASAGTTTLGMARAKEILSLSKNMKTPKMVIYLSKEHRYNEQIAKKIASHVKMTTIGDIRRKTEIYFDPNPTEKGSIMNRDKVSNVFYAYNPSRLSCQADVNKLPWVIRIVINREKMMEKKVTLLDIKSIFCNWWERRFKDLKGAKKEVRVLLENITHCAILSNDDNDKKPTIHIRFDMNEYSYQTMSDFVNNIVENFKLKGINNITQVDGIQKEPLLTFSDDDESIDMKEQYVVYVSGMNMIDLRYINGIDIDRTTCNDIVYVYNTFGIEAARSCLIKELKTVFERAGSSFNYQHLSVLVDMMTHKGFLISIDRHGMNKTNKDPLAKASFEKTVDLLQRAAVFGEVDHMTSVSSRIMTGQVVKGGTGICDTVMDVEMIEKSEYIEDLEVQYKKTFKELSVTTIFGEIEGNSKKHSFSPIF